MWDTHPLSFARCRTLIGHVGSCCQSEFRSGRLIYKLEGMKNFTFFISLRRALQKSPDFSKEMEPIMLDSEYSSPESWGVADAEDPAIGGAEKFHIFHKPSESPTKIA